MDVRKLEYLVAVADHGGFTRAAASLHVSQPALSEGIRSLESELGVELFHRVGRRAVLSAAGEALLGPARQVLRDINTANAAVRDVRGLAAGRLDIIVLRTLAAEPMARWVGHFRQAAPSVRINIAAPEQADDVIASVRSGTHELALAELPAPPDLVLRLQMDQEVFIVGAAGRPELETMTIEELAGVPLVATPPGTSMRRLMDRTLADAGVTPEVAVEINEREAVLPLVFAGAGAAFLPEPLTRAAAEQGAAIARLSPPLLRHVGLVHRDAAVSPAALAFLDAVLRVEGDGVRPPS